MNKAIVGKKLGMSQVFTAEGVVIPVTVVQAGPCPVIQVKTVEKDGYNAIKVAYEPAVARKVSGDQKASYKGVNRPTQGQYAKAGVEPMRYMRELQVDGEYEVGKVITCDVFQENDKVDVVGKTRGRGYTGVIQRWNHHRLPMSHGAGPVHREVGSMAANSDPSRVFKNKKMAGQYGNERVTIQNLTVVRVDAARNLLLIKGAIPGPKGGLVIVKTTVK
ncbi:MAG: 50S ribosomal protein L3 [Clostridia bacterium]|nr:50S ribosomal protein L3 [Clostridia bacterium]